MNQALVFWEEGKERRGAFQRPFGGDVIEGVEAKKRSSRFS